MTAPTSPTKPLILGWREWFALPELQIPAIKAKLDTGARTSALHTFFIEPFTQADESWVRFGIHPVQKRTDIEIVCEAKVIDQRQVTDSGGHREMRWVILTSLHIHNQQWPIEMTLTNRESMRFRMLLGRTAMHDRIWVDPASSFLSGRALKKNYRLQ